MIISILLLSLSLLLSSVIPNLLRDFIPFFMISAIVIISVLSIKEKDMYIIIFIFGILYDLLYTDLVIFHGFIFIGILYLSKIILKDSKNFFFIIFNFYLMVILYSILMYLFSFLYTSLNIILLINMVIKSLLINFIFFIIIYVLFIGIKCLISNTKKKNTY